MKIGVVRDEHRDPDYVYPLAKCEILSTHMPMVEGSAVSAGANVRNRITATVSKLEATVRVRLFGMDSVKRCLENVWVVDGRVRADAARGSRAAVCSRCFSICKTCRTGRRADCVSASEGRLRRWCLRAGAAASDTISSDCM